MPVFLRHSADRSPEPAAEASIAVGATARRSFSIPPLADLARRLETAFTASRETWWSLAQAMRAAPSARYAHAATCAPGPSDLGAMLAWSHLVGELARGPAPILAVCDDPWLFRHLRTLPGVFAGPAPGIASPTLVAWMRGAAARCAAAARLMVAAIRLRGQHRKIAPGGTLFVAYGHPASAPDRDAYFADLPWAADGRFRIQHADCGPARARALGADPRTASIHAFANPAFALLLPFVRWRPGGTARSGCFAWLVRRAAHREGRGAAAALSAWQMHAQRRMLAALRPRAVAWPWESHPWERDLVRAARAVGTRTVGSVHTVVGPHMFNMAPAALADSATELPDRLLSNGPGASGDLLALGMPAERLRIAGALRFQPGRAPRRDRAAPVYVALPSARAAARELLDAVERLAADGAGPRFAVRDHPMYPMAIRETARLGRAAASFGEQDAVSALVFCASTVGLEGLLAGIPTVRFRTETTVAIDVLPQGLRAAAADGAELGRILAEAIASTAAKRPAWDDVFAPVERAVWDAELNAPAGEC